MKVKCFTIYDSKAGAYLPPFFLPNEKMARRTFSDCVNIPSHAFCQHPADYTLFTVGEFDDSNGQFTPSPVIAICNGVDVMPSLSEPDNIAMFNAEARSA